MRIFPSPKNSIKRGPGLASSVVVRLKGLVKVLFFYVNERLCKRCFKNERTLIALALDLNEYLVGVILLRLLENSPILHL